MYATKSSQSASSSLQHKQHGTSNTTDSAQHSTAKLNWNSTSRGASKSHKTNRLASEKDAGTSANAGPHYQKLYARVIHIWGNRKGQPDRSAMERPHLERTASLIAVPPMSKVFLFLRRMARPSVRCAMPPRHPNYKQLTLRVVHKHAKLAGVMSPAPKKNSIQKLNTKNSSQHILTFYLGQRHGSFQGSKDENGKERERRVTT